MKLAFGIIGSLCCLVFALIPEAAMYFLYGVVNPTTTLERILVLGAFWFGGAGMCVLFGFLALAVWTALIKTVLE